MLARFLRLPSSLGSNKMSLQNEKRKINYAEVITVSSFLGPDHLVAVDFHFVLFFPILLVNSKVYNVTIRDYWPRIVNFLLKGALSVK